MTPNEEPRPLGAAGVGKLLSFPGGNDNPTYNPRWWFPQAANSRLRLQFLAGRLHTLGPKPLFHFLDEVERGANLRSHLEKYATLPADFIRAYGGGDQFPKLFAIRGDRL